MREIAMAVRRPRESALGACLRSVAPYMFGLVFARAGLIAATYGAYRHTDDGVFTDGSTLVALCVLFVGMVALVGHKKSLSQRTVMRVMVCSVSLEALVIFGLAAVDVADAGAFSLRFALSVTCTLAGSLSIFFWLRAMKGTSSVLAAVFAFGALATSEVELYLCSLIPPFAGCLVAGTLALAQFACIGWARRMPRPQDAPSLTAGAEHEDDYFFSFGKMAVSSTRLLTAIALGIGALSIVIGFLRGYPAGQPIPFTPPTRALYASATILLSIAFALQVVHGHRRTLTVGIFVIMELLACLALMLYGAFPANLEVGAVCTTTLNALMVGFTWYAIVAFMSHGRYDAYYYAFACWLVWLGFRAMARMALLEMHFVAGNDLFITAFMGMLVVVSTLVVFLQFLGTATAAAEARMLDAEMAAQRLQEDQQRLLTRIMGLGDADSGEPANLSAMREEAMRHSAEQMGRQFLLSDREVEVLAMYAIGHTQKRVAEELFISQGTVHAHVKNIYSKTNLHSRQELIDYLKQFTD